MSTPIGRGGIAMAATLVPEALPRMTSSPYGNVGRGEVRHILDRYDNWAILPVRVELEGIG
jgi:hypothetical protein